MRMLGSLVATVVGLLLSAATIAAVSTVTSSAPVPLTLQLGSPYASESSCVAAAQATIAASTNTSGTFVYQCGATILTATYSVDTPTCTTLQPAPVVSTITCPTGTTGTWSQTAVYSAAAYPTCWTLGTPTPASPPSGSCPPVVVTPPPTTGYSVYKDGVLGGGDGNWVSNFNNPKDTVNAKDTGNKPPSGTYDLLLTIGETYGMWLPYSNNPAKTFSMVPYTTVQFDVMPPGANAPSDMYFVPAGDESVDVSQCGINFPNAKYGANFTAGQWVHVTIPLADMCVKNATLFPGGAVYKFGFQDQSGTIGKKWRFANVSFQ